MIGRGTRPFARSAVPDPLCAETAERRVWIARAARLLKAMRIELPDDDWKDAMAVLASIGARIGCPSFVSTARQAERFGTAPDHARALRRASLARLATLLRDLAVPSDRRSTNMATGAGG